MAKTKTVKVHDEQGTKFKACIVGDDVKQVRKAAEWCYGEVVLFKDGQLGVVANGNECLQIAMSGDVIVMDGPPCCPDYDPAYDDCTVEFFTARANELGSYGYSWA